MAKRHGQYPTIVQQLAMLPEGLQPGIQLSIQN